MVKINLNLINFKKWKSGYTQYNLLIFRYSYKDITIQGPICCFVEQFLVLFFLTQWDGYNEPLSDKFGQADIWAHYLVGHFVKKKRFFSDCTQWDNSNETTFDLANGRWHKPNFTFSFTNAMINDISNKDPTCHHFEQILILFSLTQGDRITSNFILWFHGCTIWMLRPTISL